MKKFISFAMAALMVAAMSATAFAAEINQDATLPADKGTTVTYTVLPTYTVTIPENVELKSETAADGKISYTGSGVISTGDSVRLKYNEYIKVVLDSDFIMESEEKAKENYEIFLNGSTAALTDKAVVAKFGTFETKQQSTIKYVAGDPTFAGTYTDTVTFNISIETK